LRPGEEALQQSSTNQGLHGGVGAGLAPLRPSAPVSAAGSSGEGTVSLADMAQRDLDAALQLLADRAQYITGASGAAIALRRDGRNDMLCRASAGSNAPELGALLSAEYGLSGESVRTRRPLRCDDAERDARVNREVCRQLGIASVVVMPVVHDDEVLGVFELFSGKANAFGERDLSAVQRLSEMVETAVRLARATERLRERLKAREEAAVEAATVEEDFLDGDILEVDVVEPTPAMKAASTAPSETAGGKVSETIVSSLPGPAAAPMAKAETAAKVTERLERLPAASAPVPVPPAPAAVVVAADSKAAEKHPQWPETERVPAIVAPLTMAAAPLPAAPVQAPAKPLYWSAAAGASENVAPASNQQSNVPPVLRALRKCEACGFPVSGGRVLCVECEEKKWRGQLRRPVGTPMPTGALPAAQVHRAEAKAQGAAVGSAAATGGQRDAGAVSPKALDVPVRARQDSAKSASQPTVSVPVAKSVAREPEPQRSQAGEASSAIFSSGLEPSQSWLARNKYVLGVLAAVAATIGAVVLLR
jgi:GAF domain